MPEINFFWDPLSDNILQERDETGAVTAEYTAEPGLYGNIISQNRGGVESQFHYDAQGSTLAVTDDNQNVTDTFAYTAFGEVTERTGTTDVPFQYIGQKGYYTDSATGQIMARRRPYESARARWLCRDLLDAPLTHHGGYTYAANSPLTYIDPSGLISVEIVKVFRGCGKRSGVWWTFTLGKPADCFGYFVQRVTSRECVNDCVANNCPPAHSPCARETVADFWEAFPVSLRQVHSIYNAPTFPRDDEFSLNVPDQTCGFKWTSRAELRFYCAEDIGSLHLGYEGSWPKNPTWKPPHPDSGTVPSSRNEPDFWSKPSKELALNRSLLIAWCCCGSESATKHVNISVSDNPPSTDLPPIS